MDSFVVASFAAKGFNQFDGCTELVKGIELEDFDVLDVLNAGVGVFIQQRFQHLARCTGVFGEVVTLFHLFGAFFTRQRRLVERDVADQVKRIEWLALFLFHFFGQGFPHHALGCHFVDDDLFLLGITPMAQKVVQRGELFLHAGTGVVVQRFGDQSAIRPVVLDTLGDDIDRDAVDDVFDELLAVFLAGKIQIIAFSITPCADAIAFK